MKKLFYYFGLTVLGLMIVLYLYYFYQMFWPVKVFTVNSISMVTPIVKAGDDAIYHIDYCRYFKGNIHIYKSIVGPSIINIPDAVSATAPACHVTDIHQNIPISTIPGTYYIKVVTETKVNPTRTVDLNYQTPPFQVIN